ncbi:MAG: peptidase S41, partial [Paludibacteraceae bacterium]|nr:peptidase S41 [Paludibacteraceae bacterium]
KSIAPATEFEISDAEYNDFKQYVLDSKFTYKVSTKELLDDCIKGAKFEGVYERNKALFDSLSTALNHDVASEMDSAKAEICKALTSEIISRYYYETGIAAYAVKHDKEIKQAIELITDEEKFNKILK